MMKFSLVFLLAWSCVFLSGTSTYRIRKTDIGLKSLEELILIRRTLNRQALRLRGLEINLHHVLSKVVFLSDADIHAPGRFSSRADPLTELSERLNVLLKRLSQEEQVCQERSSRPLETSLNQTLQKDIPKVDFYQPAKSDCYELDEAVRVDGVYRFLVPERNEVQRDLHERYCAFATDGPAWTVIQNRAGSFDPIENFNRTWDEYRAGFGNLSRDFWFGNEFTHKILYRDDHELRVELREEEVDQSPVDWAEYSIVRLDSERYNYQLTVEGDFRGSLPDALGQLNGTEFSTHDRRRNGDLGTSGDSTCAEQYGGGWWFNGCTQSNLNGELGVHQRASPAVIWSNWRTGTGKPKNSRMMIRPVNPVPGGYFYED
ncbi:techylectin-5B [Drosophila biarmipes]|uniref:techylectin-5B n=1 Tax=Drosophila biarmipes TaxID=125945 RepID=UPI0007E81433|nr:techylectin-5B [Drosophila biarmipes]